MQRSAWPLWPVWQSPNVQTSCHRQMPAGAPEPRFGQHQERLLHSAGHLGNYLQPNPRVVRALSRKVLAIGPFRQGSALWTHNEHVTSRRVIIKKVPSAVSEENLRRALETDFGTITRMYRFAAESSLKAVKRENPERPTPTLLNSLKSPQHAKQLKILSTS